MVDVAESAGPEVSGLNKQNFDARSKHGKFLCEALNSSYIQRVCLVSPRITMYVSERNSRPSRANFVAQYPVALGSALFYMVSIA